MCLQKIMFTKIIVMCGITYLIFAPGQRGGARAAEEACPGWGWPHLQQEQFGAGKQGSGREGEGSYQRMYIM